MISALFTETITLARYGSEFTLTFSANLIAGNSVTLNVNGVAVGPVVFATSHALTMAALAVAIAATAAVATATVSGRVITMTKASDDLSVINVIVTGGVSQPTAALAGGYIAGTMVPPVPTSLTLTASVQPVKGRELLNFPEAQRTKGIIKIYSTTAMQTANEAAGTKADIVTYQGKQWEIHEVNYWPHLSQAHYKAIAFKVDGD